MLHQMAEEGEVIKEKKKGVKGNFYSLKRKELSIAALKAANLI
jgi:hypothetical protein